MNKMIVLLLCIALSSPAQAQTDKCGFDTRIDQAIQDDPNFLETLQQQELDIKAVEKRFERSLENKLTTVPVVVHVLHLGQDIGSGVNISDVQIISAIDQLNKAFSGIDGYGTPNSNIQFSLASRTPDCQPTNGIIRVDARGICGNNDCYDIKGITALNESAVKSISSWPARDYLNIWVVREIDNNEAKLGVQGFAQFPGANPLTDGVTILYNAFGYQDSASGPHSLKSNTRLGTILIHEVGHALGLYHSFEGDDYNRDGIGDRCPSFTGCGPYNGDCITDTPPHRRSLGTCLVSGTNVCDGGFSNELFVHNFMDYSSEDCQYEFTKGQVDRMRATLQTGRLGWSYSAGHIPVVTGGPVVANCTPQTKYLNNTFGLGIREFRLGDQIAFSGTTTEDGGYLDQWCTVFSTQAGKTYSLMVNTGTQNTQNLKVYVDYNGDGDFEDLGEQVFSSDKAKLHQGNIAIPSTAKQGSPLRIRAIASYSGFKISGPCFQPFYGQVEDYTLMIGTPMADADDELAHLPEAPEASSFLLTNGEDDYTIYPNPVSDRLYISNPGISKIRKLEILDIGGKVTISLDFPDLNDEVFAINLAKLSSGMHYVRITDDVNVTIKKLNRI